VIRALELQNFKGVAARQRIDFAPLTLLFGANSAGKSTVLQALLYLHELLERGSADVDRTEIGGDAINLGGFGRLLHRHDANNAIVLRAEFTTPGGLERFGRDLKGFPFPNLDDQVEAAWLELTIRFRTMRTFSGPLVERAVIGVDSDPLVWLETGSSLRHDVPLFARVNLAHPLIAEAAHEIAESWKEIAITDDYLGLFLKAGGALGTSIGLVQDSVFADGSSLPVFVVASSRPSALPSSDSPLRVIEMGDSENEVEEPTDQDWEDFGAHDHRMRQRTIRDVQTFLEMTVLGTTAQLAVSLQEALYIGPLRAVPSKGSLYDADSAAGSAYHPVGGVVRARAKRNTSWADGLAAWDLLLADRSSLVDETNAWLKKVGAGCQVVVHELVDMTAANGDDLSKGYVEEVVHRLMLDAGGSWVLPAEVGAGISQVIPVVVAALSDRASLSLIEQPELHIHPALQVWLGDLFIEAVTRDGGRRAMLIETHSEHLILRILRRIRETTENELDGGPAFSADKLSVLYVENGSDGVQFRRLLVDERGEFKDRWPKGFFAERAEELF
jgi:hypothetical protein